MPNPTSQPSPLAGMRVVDFSIGGVGPWAAAHLGLLGADVIKIESPDGDMVRNARPTMKGMGAYYIGNNYAKRGITLDLKQEDDRRIALALVKTADIALDNFRSKEVLIRLGLGYEVMSKINPRIIYLQSSAYGPIGPMVGMTNSEWYAQTSGGSASVNGESAGPPQLLRGIAHMDWNAAMINCFGLLAAVYARERTGRGMYLETNQFQASVTAGLTRFAEYFASGVAPEPLGSGRPNIVPDQAFPTAMGYIAVSVLRDVHWKRLCEVLDTPGIAEDPRFLTNTQRVAHRNVLIPLLEDAFRARTAWHWLERLRQEGVPCGEYFEGKPQTLMLREHPQINANEMMTTIATPWGPINQGTGHWRFSKSAKIAARPAPQTDEHRDEILAEIGFAAGRTK